MMPTRHYLRRLPRTLMFWLFITVVVLFGLRLVFPREGFDKLDRVHLDALLHCCIREAAELDALLARHVDRKTSLLSPVEHAVLMIGVYELKHCIDIPYRVAINEGGELAKSFGGTDGHKFVNAVLDKVARGARAPEIAALAAERGR